MKKYGLTGRSILFASGDDGTGCTSNCKLFQPNWPATSPYVTAVGGLYLQGSTAYGDEISSGGFSNFFSQVLSLFLFFFFFHLHIFVYLFYPFRYRRLRYCFFFILSLSLYKLSLLLLIINKKPSYQSTAVSGYLQAHGKKPAPSSYNATGRGVPDIASFSENVLIYLDGGMTEVGGTSCAAPVISGTPSFFYFILFHYYLSLISSHMLFIAIYCLKNPLITSAT